MARQESQIDYNSVGILSEIFTVYVNVSPPVTAFLFTCRYYRRDLEQFPNSRVHCAVPPEQTGWVKNSAGFT